MQPGKGRKGKSFKQRLVLKSSLAKETISEFLGTFIMIVSISWILTQLCLSFVAGGGCFVFFKFVTRVIFSRQEHITSRLFWAIYWPQVRFPFTHFVYSQEFGGGRRGVNYFLHFRDLLRLWASFDRKPVNRNFSHWLTDVYLVCFPQTLRWLSPLK